MYAQLDGSISQKKYYAGLEERTAVYDLSNAEGLDELVKGGTDRLKD